MRSKTALGVVFFGNTDVFTIKGRLDGLNS